MWGKIVHENRKQKRRKVALILEKIDFKLKNVTGEKEDNSIIMKGSTHQEDITIVNIHEPNIKGLMLKLKLQNFGHLMRRVDSLEKTLMLGGIGDRRRRG